MNGVAREVLRFERVGCTFAGGIGIRNEILAGTSILKGWQKMTANLRLALKKGEENHE